MSKRFLTCYGLWCSLGAYRGIQKYNNNYREDHNFYLENPKSKKPEYYYSDFMASTLMGLFLYGNPFLLPNFAYEEIFDLEKKLRGIKSD